MTKNDDIEPHDIDSDGDIARRFSGWQVLLQFPVGVNLGCGPDERMGQSDKTCDCLFIYEGTPDNGVLARKLCGPQRMIQ